MILKFFLLAITFLFASCSVPERDNPLDPDGVNYVNGVRSSSSIVVVYSSSKVTPSSSSTPIIIYSSSAQTNITYGPNVDYGNEIYETVVIGTQTWFKRNLNYNATGSLCYNNQDSYCATYGRLYNWATAMDLPADCNKNSCWNKVQQNHKGICPGGWHIPSDEDWMTLVRFIGSSEKAGTKLKATNGWSSSSGSAPRGTDNYGFSALPGGSADFYNPIYFRYAGSDGYWWSTYECIGSDDCAFYRQMSSSYENAYWSSTNKSYMHSVRCVQDNSSSSVAPSSSSVTPSGPIEPNCNVVLSSVTIGDQIWMAENLNCDVSGGHCYNEDPDNCAIYGRLYDWATAMALPESCNSSTCSDQIKRNHRGLCPSGWHIPSSADWNALMRYIIPNCENGWGCPGSGTKLRSTDFWAPYSKEGTNDYGFTALPGGVYGGNMGYNNTYNNINSIGNWWSTLEYSKIYSYYRYMNGGDDEFGFMYGSKNDRLSVRCLKD